MEFLAENIAQNTTTAVSQADAPNGVFKADRAGLINSIAFRFGVQNAIYPNTEDFFIYNWALYDGAGGVVFSDDFSSYAVGAILNAAPYVVSSNIGGVDVTSILVDGSPVKIARFRDISSSVNTALIYTPTTSLASGRIEAKIRVSATQANTEIQVSTTGGHLVRVRLAPNGAISLLNHNTLSTPFTVPMDVVKDLVITWTGATATQKADMTITLDGENIFHDYGDLFNWRTDVALQKIPPKLAFSAADYAKINYAALFDAHTAAGVAFTNDPIAAVPNTSVQKIANNEITLNFGTGTTGKILWLGNKQELQGNLAPGSTYPIRENYKRYISTNQVGQFHEIRADIKGTPYRIQLNNIPSGDNALGDMLDQIRTLPFFVKLLNDWHLVYENSPETSLPTLQTTPAHLQIILNLITIPR